MAPPGLSHTSFGPLSGLPSKRLASTVCEPSGAIDHSAVCSSAHASRCPFASKYMPLARPAGWRNVESVPSTLHFMMRLLG